MRRAANLFDLIYEPENLRAAFHKAARGRRGQAVVSQFAASLDERIAEISTERDQYIVLITLRRDVFWFRTLLCFAQWFGSVVVICCLVVMARPEENTSRDCLTAERHEYIWGRRNGRVFFSVL